MKNRWEKRGDHYVIFANRRGIQHEILVDEADFEEVAASFGTWHAHKNGNTFYAQTNIRDANGKWKTVQMHRVILNPPANRQVDHRNHNGLDNRRKNCRFVTNGENQRNRIDNTEFQSDADGVSWKAHAKAWMAQPRVNGKLVHLGYFDEEREAEAAKLMYSETGIRVKRIDLRRIAAFQSGVPGVSWDTWAKAWKVYPWMNGNRIHLGYFDTEIEAHAALLMYQETGMRVKRAKARSTPGIKAQLISDAGMLTLAPQGSKGLPPGVG